MRKLTKITAILVMVPCLVATAIELLSLVFQKPLLKLFYNYEGDISSYFPVCKTVYLLISLILAILVFRSSMKMSNNAKTICIFTVVFFVVAPIIFSFLQQIEMSILITRVGIDEIAASNSLSNIMSYITSPLQTISHFASCILLGVKLAESQTFIVSDNINQQ